MSLPFSSHIAAYIINRGKNKKWIMDIGDPFSLKNNAFENNRYLYKSLNYYFENKFYKKADQVVFTHQESANEHKKFFNISEKKLQSGTLLVLLVRSYSKNQSLLIMKQSQL